MYRAVIKKLKKWKETPFNRPLIVTGAPQVGKTRLIKDFGANNYYRAVYIDLSSNDDVKMLFTTHSDVWKLFYDLGVMFNITNRPKNVLIFFDNVQCFPEILNWLDRFNDGSLEYSIVCAGTISDDELYSGIHFSLNNVDVIKLYPLYFDEFLMNLGHKKLYDLLHSGNRERIDTFSEIYIFLLKQYLYIGGMPEAVLCFSNTQDYREVRKVQNKIINKHKTFLSQMTSAIQSSRAESVWDSIPAQLKNKNGRFKFDSICSTARAADYIDAIKSLCGFGLTYKIDRIIEPMIPLKNCTGTKAFKFYSVDVGLLSCMTGIEESMINNNDAFSLLNGMLTEQYVLQQLLPRFNNKIYYYTNNHNNGYIPFLLDNGKNAIPIDIALKYNPKAKCLKTYQEKYNPPLSFSVTLESQQKDDDGIKPLPLYSVLQINTTQQ